MIRKLSAVLVAAACAAAGFAAGSVSLAEAEPGAVPTAAARSALPTPGSYSGVDHAGRVVSFSFSGNQMSHFTVNHQVIGGAHVGSSAWHETCHGGRCTEGLWKTDTHVTGRWRTPDGHWTTFSAWWHPSMTIRPFVGHYTGSDHTGLRVRFRLHHSTITGFELDHSTRGNAPVGSNGTFNTCLTSICVKGHWQSEYDVVGWWKPASGGHWVAWDVYAYAP